MNNLQISGDKQLNPTLFTQRTAVVIGRFQPPHKGHYFLIEQALRACEKVVVLIGSADERRTPKNPLTFSERVASLPKAPGRVTFAPVPDFEDDNDWIAHVKNSVPSDDVALIGYKKDGSSYYLDLFPEWEFIEAEPYLVDGKVVSSTELRVAEYLQEGSLHVYKHYIASIEERLLCPAADKAIILKHLRLEFLHAQHS